MKQKASLVRHVSNNCALAGQIKNDLRESERQTLTSISRIRDGVRNSCILRLLQVADEEAQWTTKCWAVAEH